jgi:cephalosporin hydroxylase
MDQASRINEIQEFIQNAGSDNLSVFSGKFEGGVNCQQVPDEFAQAIAAMQEYQREIDNYLEIGVAAGGTTYHMNYFFSPEKIVLVDDNMHIKAPLRPEILAGIPARKEIIGKSGSDAVKAKVAALGLKYDLIIIDGDHTYEGVKADVENYLPWLADGGFLMFHDSALPDWGVMAVVAELKGSKDLEFIGEYKSTMRAPLGIALFRKIPSPPRHLEVMAGEGKGEGENNNRSSLAKKNKPSPFDGGGLGEGEKPRKEIK